MFTRRFLALTFLFTLVGSGQALLAAEDAFEQVRSRVREHTLANGLKFIVLERHDVPVVSFVTIVNAGSADEPAGETGVAHMFEHMAFKGTRRIGTKNYDEETKLLAAQEIMVERLLREKRKGSKADPEKIQRLEKAIAELDAKVAQHTVSEEYSTLLERHGAAGLNASTGPDLTSYYVDLPSNKMELWMALEADRFANPVLREFYKERDVVLEERRMRTESDPFGKLIEEVLAAAYKAHPYGNPTIGHRSDLENLTRTKAEHFYRRYYNPNNTVISVVGDVDAERVFQLAEKYFGAIPRGPAPERIGTIEPPQEGEKRVTVETEAQPVIGLGYHKPSALDPDDVVFDVLATILGGGRASRLYRRMVKEEQSALAVGCWSTVPGSRYPNLFAFYAAPNAGHTVEEMDNTLAEEIEKLRTASVDEKELRRAKRIQRAHFLRGLESRDGLAETLASYEALLGGWREMFEIPRRIDKVTAEDIRRVAQTYFTRRNRVVGHLVPKAGQAPEPEPES